MQFISDKKLLTRDNAVLVVIDVQEKLIPAISDGDTVVNNIVTLVKFANIIGIPILITEQEKLGPTLPQITDELKGVVSINKLEFNSGKCGAFVQELGRLNRASVIMTGVESHICITQTALHLMPEHIVHVISDAISSRSRHNHQIAIERMRDNGAVISSTEMVIFELLGKAGTDEFRATLPLVK